MLNQNKLNCRHNKNNYRLNKMNKHNCRHNKNNYKLNNKNTNKLNPRINYKNNLKNKYKFKNKLKFKNKTNQKHRNKLKVIILIDFYHYYRQTKNIFINPIMNSLIKKLKKESKNSLIY